MMFITLLYVRSFFVFLSLGYKLFDMFFVCTFFYFTCSYKNLIFIIDYTYIYPIAQFSTPVALHCYKITQDEIEVFPINQIGEC
jgi:hypothetical protein